uniref:NADH-ubiquinone oxidoreductase chain 5 n=1 Tax=Mecistocephalus marmoratus TaxID=980230 RepID=A0A4Y1K7M2_9MYRI|nr:NADH dehydrogenase subunit 5 [Mecistocephalus marmoratus]ARU77314.1 NADH dehydrogenase subunit 5 [Mecistocephalus marmoratus]
MVNDFCKMSGYFLGVMSLSSFMLGLYFIMVGSSFFIDWMLANYSSCDIVFSIVIDWMSLLFLSFVLFISSSVMLYSIDYMDGDLSKNRFCLIVVMFVVSMLLVILSPNLISLLLGWDGLGLVSYCLVIYYQNQRAYNAGMITVLSNRIGDVALLMSIALFLDWGDWGFVQYSSWGWEGGLVLCLCVLAGMTKSAQIPFSAWLPAAMAAPTPVSALVHSSTLVTAGVYLMIRFAGTLGEGTWWVLMVLSCLTMFMAGVGANFEYDLKSIIALSTLSQLGLMMLSLSMGFVGLAFFHLLTHAMFKALLFLCAGAIIHISGEWQDIRMMGGLGEGMPVIGVCMNVANLALCGFPFMAGFYSKDMILEWVILGGSNLFILFLLMISIGLTSCYSIRMAYYVMWKGRSSMGGGVFEDGGSNMHWPVAGLSFFGITVGSSLMWLMFLSPGCIVLPEWLKMSGVILMLFGVWAGLIIFWGSGKSNILLKRFLGSMWFLPGLSGEFISVMAIKEGGEFISVGDAGWGELWGGQGMYSILSSGGGVFQWWQDNSLKLSLFTFFIWSWGVFFLL